MMPLLISQHVGAVIRKTEGLPEAETVFRFDGSHMIQVIEGKRKNTTNRKLQDERAEAQQHLTVQALDVRVFVCATEGKSRVGNRSTSNWGSSGDGCIVLRCPRQAKEDQAIRSTFECF